MKTKNISIIAIMLLVLMFTITGCTLKPQVAPEPEKEEAALTLDEPAKVEETKSEEANSDSDSAGSVIKVDEANFEEKVLNSKGVMLVDFWAAWCGPCVQLAPILEDVSAEAGITVAKLNVDENPNLANEYKINAIPAVYVFVDGVAKETIIGVNPKENYINTINKYR